MLPKLTAILLPLLVIASAALADDQCSGTLCDFYYGKSSGSFDDKPKPAAPPKPLLAPTGGFLGLGGGSASAAEPGAQAPAKRPLVGVGGGGIASMARGEAQEPCSGTFCDLYYGKSRSFDDEKEATPQTAPVAAATAPDATEVAETPAPSPEMQGFHTRPEPPRCAAGGRDPWSCYR